MSSNNFFQSDLNRIHNIIQSSMLSYPKELVIATLRNYFSKDSYYHYSKDQWGFANTTDHTDLPPGADMPYGPGSNPLLKNSQNLSTRLFIGENYRYDGIYYPAILVKSNGSKYVPISINREKGGIQYTNIFFEDGYGNEMIVRRPDAFITAGAWEGSLNIDILTRSLRARDDLVEQVAMCFTEVNFEDLVDVGLVIKPISIGGTSETDDRNDKLFRQNLTLDIRTEWRREIPIGNLIDAIFFTATFEDLSRNDVPASPNLAINNNVSIYDFL